MDFDFAQYRLRGGKMGHEFFSSKPGSLSQIQYHNLLLDALSLNRTRILSFNNNKKNCFSQSAPPQKRRRRRVVPKSASFERDTEPFANLLDWGSSGNYLALAIQDFVLLWEGDYLDNDVAHVFSVSDDEVIKSVKWSIDRLHLAIGTDHGRMLVWSLIEERLVSDDVLLPLRDLSLNALDWNYQNQNVVTCGTSGGLIVDVDVRDKAKVVAKYKGHKGEVCNVKWDNGSHKHLASGGSDKLVHIWDRSMPSRWLHRFDDHNAAVRALAWCSSIDCTHLIATGGGVGDCSIKFWDARKGMRLDCCVDTGSEVCSLIWSKHEHCELLSAQGDKGNQLTLWDYPSMFKITDIVGHSNRVLYMAQSPDGYSVATAAPNDAFRVWSNVFGSPAQSGKKRKREQEPFADFSVIR